MAELTESPLLSRPARGQDVIHLQSALVNAGSFDGNVDGAFGQFTEQALRNYQETHGLAVTGSLTEETASRLGWRKHQPPVIRISGLTVETVGKLFSDRAKPNLEANLPAVINELAAVDLADRQMIAMALATVRVETSQFLPVSELPSGYNTSPNGRPFDRYDERRGLGNEGPPDGATFRGRGFVQLTGRANYQELSHTLGLGDALVKTPALAHDSQTAARILAAFLKARESRIRAALNHDCLAEARRLVNGGSNGMADFTTAFRRSLQLLPSHFDRAA